LKKIWMEWVLGMNIQILVATETAENIFIVFCKVGKFHLFCARAVGLLVSPIVQFSAGPT
jgi:hypothetical protein